MSIYIKLHKKVNNNQGTKLGAWVKKAISWHGGH